MTVAELIEVLKQCPQDLEVVVNGYEGGYSSKVRVEALRLKRDVNDAWYYGEHENAEDNNWSEAPVFHALGVLR